MERSKVYFTDFRTGLGTPLTLKLQKLIRLAGIGSIDMDGKFVAIKMHFGELGNLAYLRPNYAKAVADVIKENGGLPFLTDCNTLYPGSRKHALEHMDCANINGFNTVTTGCQIIIADGLRGTDDIIVPVPNGVYCKEAYIGRAVMDADIFMKQPDSAALSRISEWGAEAVRERCSSTRAVILMLLRKCAGAAADVLRNAVRMPSVMKIVKLGSIPENAKAAEGVSEHVHLMPSKTITGTLLSFWDAEWLNTLLQS